MKNNAYYRPTIGSIARHQLMDVAHCRGAFLYGQAWLL